MWVLPVLGIVALLFIIVTAIRCIIGRRLLKDYKKDSLIIFGKRGHGKSLLFSEMTRMDDKESGSLSNTDFKRKNQEIINIKDISVAPNTWDNVLKGEFITIGKKESWEGKSVYIDDAGIYLPNFADSMLKKNYDSMPLAFAVWRHLYNAPMHINSQACDRVWKLLREQADGFIEARYTRRFLWFAFIHCTYYKKASSAEQSLLPMKKSIFNKYNAAELNHYNAVNGEIKDFIIFAPTWRNRYDSRWFHAKFFGIVAPKSERRRGRKKSLQSSEL